jgi:hypothetical protein
MHHVITCTCVRSSARPRETTRHDYEATLHTRCSYMHTHTHATWAMLKSGAGHEHDRIEIESVCVGVSCVYMYMLTHAPQGSSPRLRANRAY